MTDNNVVHVDPTKMHRTEYIEFLARQFEEQVSELGNQLREFFKDKNATTVTFGLKISGRADGVLKVEYHMGEQYSSTGFVQGAQIMPVLNEYFRRRGWDQMNAPKELPRS